MQSFEVAECKTEGNREFVIGYRGTGNGTVSVRQVKKHLREQKLRTKVVTGRDGLIQILPVRGGHELSMRDLMYKWGFEPNQILVVGDTGQDAGMLSGETLGVVLADHGPELNRLKDFPKVFFASEGSAAGVLEGIGHYDFFEAS